MYTKKYYQLTFSTKYIIARNKSVCGSKTWQSSQTDQIGYSFCFALSRENAARDWHCNGKRSLSQDGRQEVPPIFRCCHPWGAAFSWHCPLQPTSLHTEWHILQGLYNPKGILNSKTSYVLQSVLSPLCIMSGVNVKSNKIINRLTTYLFWTGHCNYSSLALCAERGKAMGHSQVLQSPALPGP